MWRLGVLCAFDAPSCGGTAFDVRAGLFVGNGLTDKISTLRSSLYGGKFTSHIDEQLLLLPRDF
jgi:hypothetical protein